MKKMKLTSFFYKKGGSVSKGDTMEVLLNPGNISNSVTIKYTPLDIPGRIKPHMKFASIDNETFKFDLIFDGTGMISAKVDDVTTQLEEFRKITYGYKSSEHEISYVLIAWGSLSVYCRLESMSLEYSLFDKDGKPLRAKATCNFKETTPPKEEENEKNTNSPDMTHVKTVKAGYGLRHMCYDIYGESKLDIAIAKFNNFTTRYVSEGTEVILPPLKIL